MAKLQKRVDIAKLSKLPVYPHKYLIIVGGPTASGKTNLAVQLAMKYRTVILSADSRQIYQSLNIGTAKPSQEILNAVPHYFINHLPPDASMSAGRYEKESQLLLEKLFLQYPVIIAVGGTGLYLKSLYHGFDQKPEVPVEYRIQAEEIFEQNGLQGLQSYLTIHDPSYTIQGEMLNPARLIRAVAFHLKHGVPYSQFLKNEVKEKPYRCIKILLNLPREELYAAINHRVDQMIQAGLINEVIALKNYWHCQCMQTVGYVEIIEALSQKISMEEAIEKIKQHTRNYAKRQLTWFRKESDWLEFHPTQIDRIMWNCDQIMGGQP